MSILTRLIKYGTTSTDPRRQFMCREIRRELVAEFVSFVDRIVNIAIAVWLVQWLSQF